jgi:hypothetical protein
MRAFERPCTIIVQSYNQLAIVMANIFLLRVAKTRPKFGHSGESLTAIGWIRSYKFQAASRCTKKSKDYG